MTLQFLNRSSYYHHLYLILTGSPPCVRADNKTTDCLAPRTGTQNRNPQHSASKGAGRLERASSKPGDTPLHTSCAGSQMPWLKPRCNTHCPSEIRACPSRPGLRQDVPGGSRRPPFPLHVQQPFPGSGRRSAGRKRPAHTGMRPGCGYADHVFKERPVLTGTCRLTGTRPDAGRPPGPGGD